MAKTKAEESAIRKTSKFRKGIEVRAIISLVLLVSLGIAEFFLFRMETQQSEVTAATANISGRQRMLVYRAGLIARNLISSEEQSDRARFRKELLNTVKQIEKAHISLKYGDHAMKLSQESSPAIQRIFHEFPSRLDHRVVGFVEAGEKLVRALDHELHSNNPHYSYIENTLQEGKLLSALEALLVQYQRESEAKIARLEDLEIALPAALIFTIALIGFSIFQLVIEKSEQSMNQLRAQEQKFRALIESAPDAMVIVDREGKIVLVNEQTERLFRYARHELIGKEVELLIPEKFHKHHVHHKKNYLSKPKNRQMGTLSRQLQGLRKDGSEFPVEINLNPIETEEGFWVSSAIRDMTDRVRAKEEIKTLMKLPNENPNPVMKISATGTLLYANPVSQSLLHQWQCKIYEVVPKEIQRLVQKAIDLGSTEMLEVQCGAQLFQLVFVPVEGVDSTIVYGRDISRQKQIEDQLQRSQKMEAIGRLAGGIAHDFNNALAVIVSSSNILLEELKPYEPLRETAEEIDKAAQHATQLTKQLLAFGRRQVLKPKPVNLNDWVVGVDKILKRILGENIELVTKLNPKLGWIKADPAQLEQVIVNLAVNARDAMSSGGKLIIETKNSEVKEGFAGMTPVEIQPGLYVQLAVTDTGEGMEEETKRRVFEPFFTTKPEGKGTGLGLATVFGIVKQSGGYIGLYSEKEKGTTFKIYLPRINSPEKRKVEAPKKDILLKTEHNGTGTILLVEDEEMVRRSTRRILQRAGYNVLDVPNAGEALLLCEQYDEKIDLLLTDVVMPKMNGRELVEQLEKLRPSLKALFMSGYTEDAIVHNGSLEPGLAFIEKPFSPARLLEKVHEILHSDSVGQKAVSATI